MFQDRGDIAKVARKRESSSEKSKLATLPTVQTTNELDAVYNYRPPDLSAPPITIYHKVFPKFLNEMETTPSEDYTNNELRIAHRFILKASSFYRDKTERVYDSSSKFQEMGIPILNKDSHKLYGCDAEPDGFIFCSRRAGDFYPTYIFTEISNEMGEGGFDPSATADRDYVATYSSDKASHIRDACYCPALLVSLAGLHA